MPGPNISATLLVEKANESEISAQPVRPNYNYLHNAHFINALLDIFPANPQPAVFQLPRTECNSY